MKYEIPGYIKEALETLKKNGYEAYIVGGAVRDALKSVPPHDYDITTDAAPEEIKKAFSEYSVFETGIKHGTVTVVLSGENVEITTYRIDGEYTDNRRPDKIEYTRSLEADLARRDFTVNAMAYDPETGLVDPFNGFGDIKNKVIRCVGDPEKRFNEDALRILRALRFASVLGYTIENETKKALFTHRRLLDNISGERIFVEFKKILCGMDVYRILMEYAGIISVFLPELDACRGFLQNSVHHRYDVFEHTARTVAAVKNEPILRLAAFFHDIGKPAVYSEDIDGHGHFKGHEAVGAEIARGFFNRIKSDLRTKKDVVELVKYHDTYPGPDRIKIKRLLSAKGYAFFDKLLELQKADNLAKGTEKPKRMEIWSETTEVYEKIKSEKPCLSLDSLALDGQMLISGGIAEGEKIGVILKALLEAVITERVENTKESLLNYMHDNIIL